MATHDYDIANQSGANFSTDLNNCLDAIVSNNSNASDPSTTFAYMWWVDTSNNVLKLRNSANNAWITLPMSITASNTITPTLNMGTGAEEDVKIVFDGNAQDFYIALDDSADDLLIGKGSTVGTTPAIAIDENLLTTLHGGLTMVGTTPTLTIGDGGEEDTKIVFDGNAQDFYIGLDDSADDLVIGLGSAVGTNPALSIDSALRLNIGKADSVTGHPLEIQANASGQGLGVYGRSSDDFSFIGFYANGANTEHASIRSDNTANINFKTNGSERGRFTSDGDFLVRQTAAAVFDTNTGGDVRQFWSNQFSGANNTATKVAVGSGTALALVGGATQNASSKFIINSYMGFANSSTTAGSESGFIQFFTSTGGAAGTEKVRITDSGNLLVGTTASTGNGGVFQVKRTNAGACGYFETNASSIQNIIDIVQAANVGASQAVRFHNNGYGNVVGSIGFTTSATSYNTSSDARLKDVTGEARGLEVIKELNPVAYKWKEDGKADEGLIAQEVLDIVPNAVTGSLEDMYQMDYSKIVVHLVKGMKEQQKQIEDLKKEIETFKD